MAKLQNYHNDEDVERAKDNNYVETKYTGTTPALKGKKGVAYFNVTDDVWYFSPTKIGEKPDWYRVREDNLDISER